MSGPDDPVATTLSEIRGRGYRNGATGAGCARLSDAAAVDIPRLLTALEAVLKRHRRIPDQSGVADGPSRLPLCSGCRVAWPCDEYEAIRASLLGEEAGNEQ